MFDAYDDIKNVYVIDDVEAFISWGIGEVYFPRYIPPSLLGGVQHCN